MFKTFWSIFLKGFAAIFPIGIILALLIWIYDTIERIFSFLILQVLGLDYYFPGLGVVVGIASIFGIGLLMNAWIAQKLYEQGERVLQRIPLIKTLYGSIRDLMHFFSADKSHKGGSVVSVQLAGFNVIGLVTRQEFHDLPEGIATEEQVAVYIPMSYQFGGFTLFIPRQRLTPIDLTIEQAMRLIMTAGMQGERSPAPLPKQ